MTAQAERLILGAMVEKVKLEKISFWGWRCPRCGHQWVPREQKQREKEEMEERRKSNPAEVPRLAATAPEVDADEVPKACAGCKSEYWREKPVRSRKKGQQSAAEKAADVPTTATRARGRKPTTAGAGG